MWSSQKFPTTIWGWCFGIWLTYGRSTTAIHGGVFLVVVKHHERGESRLVQR
jgi:hypothetical protein